MYVGSINKETKYQWCYDGRKNKLVYKKLTYIPAILQIVDEILVNALDNQHRNKQMTYIKINYNFKDNQIEIKNDGSSIPIRIHKNENIYIPELIFGNLLTSSNYNDDQQRYTGGRHGYGAKLTNIFSSNFKLHIIDAKRNLEYHQEFLNNMSIINKPIIRPVVEEGPEEGLSGKEEPKKKNLTCISFTIDLKNIFNINHINTDIQQLLRKRVYDLAANVAKNNIKVYLNNQIIQINSWLQYIHLLDYSFLNPLEIYALNNNWLLSIGFKIDNTETNKIPNFLSFVNGIYTKDGGTHITFIKNLISNYILELILKK